MPSTPASPVAFLGEIPSVDGVVDLHGVPGGLHIVRSLRARILLACAQGQRNTDVAKELSITVQTVGKWRKRFNEAGLDGLVDAPRSGAPRTISDEAVEAVLTKTLEGPPPNRTHWSRRAMAGCTSS